MLLENATFFWVRRVRPGKHLCAVPGPQSLHQGDDLILGQENRGGLSRAGLPRVRFGLLPLVRVAGALLDADL